MRILVAVERPPREERGKSRDGDAIDLPPENVSYALVLVRHRAGESRVEPLHYFAQEHAALCERVAESCIGVPPQRRRQKIQHFVRKLRRREHFVRRQIRQTVENVRTGHILSPFQFL